MNNLERYSITRKLKIGSLCQKTGQSYGNCEDADIVAPVLQSEFTPNRRWKRQNNKRTKHNGGNHPKRTSLTAEEVFSL